jgi:ketosteroid isomerase-like protein
MLEGKGFFTWKIPRCEGGDPYAIASVAKSANFTHVLIKLADGPVTYNGSWGLEEDFITPVIHVLKSQGIQVWGWHYIYGYNPIGEVNKAIQRINQYELDGYVLDVEKEFQEDGKRIAAKRFMEIFRSAFPDLPVALSSYRFPSLHPRVPWSVFLEACDINMPQVYWVKAHNAGEQLERCVREFQAMTPSRPIIPTGSAYSQSGWAPTKDEVSDFLQTAKQLNLKGVNFWEWSEARSDRFQDVWEVIENEPWGNDNKPQDICERYIEALNSHNADTVSNLYAEDAVHITATRAIQGKEAIREWYAMLFSQLLPDAKFRLSSFSGNGTSRHLTWTARSVHGKVEDGSDTLSFHNDRLHYHYSFFSVSQ